MSCEYCDGSKKPIEAGVCCDARFRLNYSPLKTSFVMDVFDENDGWRIRVF